MVSAVILVESIHFFFIGHNCAPLLCSCRKAAFSVILSKNLEMAVIDEKMSVFTQLDALFRWKRLRCAQLQQLVDPKE